MARSLPLPPTAKISSPFNWESPAAQARAHGLTIRATHTQTPERLVKIAGPKPCTSCFTVPAANGSCNCA